MTRTSPTARPTAAAELRRAFLDFFVARGHTEVPSSPLVPNDPTLLFTTAGMVQFKPYYTATGDLPYTRATSVQKCLRLTDLENVGLTPRHATFFEMLGNFSFGAREQGAYFKEEAIAMAWEFVTQVLQLPVARLYPSVFGGEGPFPRDDEAIALWKKMGVPESRIAQLGRADNFWGPAGGQGACGPCSEIYFDLGETRPDYLPEGAFWGERPGDPGDRYMEFWNLVFPQFDAKADGTMTPLPRPGIDTGMGLERLALLVQDQRVIQDTDLFKPLVERVLALPHDAGRDPRLARIGARVIADHARALTFAIAEGALPGNEGAGYVLRRLLRRAVSRARSKSGLRVHEPIMPQLADAIVGSYGGHYRELATHASVIESTLRHEEEGFAATYEEGLGRLETLLASGTRSLSGKDAFLLHDTYGFPVELTEEIALERGVAIDRDGFEREMEAQRERARAGSKFERGAAATHASWTEVTPGSHSQFTGYGSCAEHGLTLRRVRDAEAGTLELVFDRTPFYAESGGQVSDTGTLSGIGFEAVVTHLAREGDSIVHRAPLSSGTREALIAAGRAGGIDATVAESVRLATQRHHTATHMLHAALRETLGTHVRQAGSLVAPDRLRFDYTHFESPSDAQLAHIAGLVSEWTLRNTPVSWQVMPIDRAKAMGAMALFGEKYGAEVRMVTVEGVPEAGIATSRELCGGTHVSRTGDIGAFVLVSDTAIASGVRRIEALCGHEAMRWLEQRGATLDRAAALFQVKPEAVPEQIEKLRADVEYLRAELGRLAAKDLERELDELIDGASVDGNARWFVSELKSAGNAETLRASSDRTRAVLGRGAFVVALHSGGKLTFMASVSDDLVAEKKLNASELVKKVAQVTGGSGGGKPHLALAGGKDLTKLADALAEARRLLGDALR